MNAQYVLADRGAAVDIVPAAATARWLIVAHNGSLRSQGVGVSIWIQLRGRSRLTAREGRFDLRRGDWLVLDRDSMPELQASRHGLTIGVIAMPVGQTRGRRDEPLPGSGRMSMADLRIAIRLWRNGIAATRESKHDAPRTSSGRNERAFQAMVQHLVQAQCDLDQAISRCPGRSIARKRQVLGRLQRARLFLEGHRDRVVRLTELAELTSFSTWYLSKVYHEIYLESTQAASVRLRLEQACELLEDCDCSISEVGVACGFDNSCSFARAFRGRYGMTASAYRQRETRDTAMAIGALPKAAANDPNLGADGRASGGDRPMRRNAKNKDFVANAKIGTPCDPKRTYESRADSLLCVVK
jgi:AraC family transcriptional regulator